MSLLHGVDPQLRGVLLKLSRQILQDKPGSPVVKAMASAAKRYADAQEALSEAIEESQDNASFLLR